MFGNVFTESDKDHIVPRGLLYSCMRLQVRYRLSIAHNSKSTYIYIYFITGHFMLHEKSFAGQNVQLIKFLRTEILFEFFSRINVRCY